MSSEALPHKRRRGREIALQLVYEMDLRPDLDPDAAIAAYPSEEEDSRSISYASYLVRGVCAHAPEIDELLREHIVGWRTERMVAVDRAAIRVALFEGVIDKKVPEAVAISEAVEITKMFSTEESSGFVNGVLGRIVRSLKEENKDGEDIQKHG